GIVQFTFSAKVDNLEVLQQFRKDLADGIIDGRRAQTAADDENHRFIGGKASKFQGADGVTCQQLLADGRTCQYSLALRQKFHGFREIAADLGGGGDAQLVCQP